MFKLLLVFAFEGAVTLYAQAPATRNVIVLLADQLRADRLHVYGNPRPTSPNIDRVAAEGTRLTRFYANAPWTAPSQGTIVTGQYPSSHGETIFALRNSKAIYPAGTVTLAEAFKAAGYHTGAFVANPVAGPYLTGRGIDDYDLSNPLQGDPRGDAPALTNRILSWLDKNQSQPFFLYIDYFQPHWPYNPPPEHDLFKTDAYPTISIAMNYLNLDGPDGFDLSRQGNVGDRKASERMVQLYDGNIHYVDASLGQLFDQLKLRGLKDNTIVLLSSDHGELLYSHLNDWDTTDHRSLYDAAMRVPAIFWGAGIPARQVVTAMASHVNTANTLLELAGLPLKADAQGPSIASLINGDPTPVNPLIYGEEDLTWPLRSVRDDRYKLILDVYTGRKTLFDTASDPDEQIDVSSFYPDQVSRLSDALARYRQANEPSTDTLRQRWLNLMNLAQYSMSQTVDDVSLGGDFQLTGDGWRLTDDSTHLYNGAYWSEPTGKVNPVRTAMWRTDNPLLGRFNILMHFGALSLGGVATNVPVTIQTRYGSQTYTVDQTQGIGTWQLITTLDDPISVTISNQANGRVIADAVQFLQVPPTTGGGN